MRFHNSSVPTNIAIWKRVPFSIFRHLSACGFYETAFCFSNLKNTIIFFCLSTYVGGACSKICCVFPSLLSPLYITFTYYLFSPCSTCFYYLVVLLSWSPSYLFLLFAWWTHIKAGKLFLKQRSILSSPRLDYIIINLNLQLSAFYTSMCFN
jgi:hypothetical protein